MTVLPFSATLSPSRECQKKPRIWAQRCLAIVLRPFDTAWQSSTKLALVAVAVTAKGGTRSGPCTSCLYNPYRWGVQIIETRGTSGLSESTGLVRPQRAQRIRNRQAPGVGPLCVTSTKSSPKNGARHFCCSRAPKNVGRYKSGQIKGLCLEARLQARKMALFGPRNSAILRHFPCPYWGRPA